MEVVNLRKSPKIELGNFKNPLSFSMSLLWKGLNRILITAKNLAAGGCLIPIKLPPSPSSWIKESRIKRGTESDFWHRHQVCCGGRLLVLASMPCSLSPATNFPLSLMAWRSVHRCLVSDIHSCTRHVVFALVNSTAEERLAVGFRKIGILTNTLPTFPRSFHADLKIFRLKTTDLRSSELLCGRLCLTRASKTEFLKNVRDEQRFWKVKIDKSQVQSNLI